MVITRYLCCCEASGGSRGQDKGMGLSGGQPHPLCLAWGDGGTLKSPHYPQGGVCAHTPTPQALVRYLLLPLCTHPHLLPELDYMNDINSNTTATFLINEFRCNCTQLGWWCPYIHSVCHTLPSAQHLD